jgi:hypothetical protein
MRLGLHLGLSSTSSSVPAIDPATLSLTGWWRAANGGEYNGSPWAGTASAGSSGSNALSEATNPPAAGSAVNTHPPADFDGTNDRLVGDGTFDTYFNAGAGSGAILFNADAITTDDGTNVYENDCLLATNSAAYFHLYLRSSNVLGIRFVDDTVGERILSIAFAGTGAWVFVQWKWNGTTLYLRVNGGSWASTPCTNLALLTDTLRIGVNYNAGQVFDGKILEIMTADSVLSDATFNGILSYERARYALSL